MLGHEVARMDQNVAIGNTETGVLSVRVADTDDSHYRHYRFLRVRPTPAILVLYAEKLISATVKEPMAATTSARQTQTLGSCC